MEFSPSGCHTRRADKCRLYAAAGGCACLPWYHHGGGCRRFPRRRPTSAGRPAPADGHHARHRTYHPRPSARREGRRVRGLRCGRYHLRLPPDGLSALARIGHNAVYPRPLRGGLRPQHRRHRALEKRGHFPHRHGRLRRHRHRGDGLCRLARYRHDHHRPPRMSGGASERGGRR